MVSAWQLHPVSLVYTTSTVDDTGHNHEHNSQEGGSPGTFWQPLHLAACIIV